VHAEAIFKAVKEIYECFEMVMPPYHKAVCEDYIRRLKEEKKREDLFRRHLKNVASVMLSIARKYDLVVPNELRDMCSKIDEMKLPPEYEELFWQKVRCDDILDLLDN
jgi:uncharacterized protein (DUF2236 family)